MPDTNTTATEATNGVVSVSAASTTAQSKYNDEVQKALTSKMRVILKRTAQLDNHRSSFDKKVAEFNKAIADAPNNAAIMAVLEEFKFPAKAIAFNPSQDD